MGSSCVLFESIPHPHISSSFCLFDSFSFSFLLAANRPQGTLTDFISSLLFSMVAPVFGPLLVFLMETSQLARIGSLYGFANFLLVLGMSLLHLMARNPRWHDEGYDVDDHQPRDNGPGPDVIEPIPMNSTTTVPNPPNAPNAPIPMGGMNNKEGGMHGQHPNGGRDDSLVDRESGYATINLLGKVYLIFYPSIHPSVHTCEDNEYLSNIT